MYIFDTSSFIVLGHYFPEVFTSLWEGFDGCVDDGCVLSCREVFRELDNGVSSNHLREWLDGNKAVFLEPTVEELAAVASFFKNSQYRNLVRNRQILNGTPVADPFIIASAQARAATVVTQESFKANGARIPTLCKDLNIECIDLQKFMLDQGWKF
jgi:hypothetical protein